MIPPPFPPSRRMPRRVFDRGSVSLEYVALGVLAALVLGGLVAVGMPAGFGAGAKAAICETVNDKKCAVDDSGDSPNGGSRDHTHPPRAGSDNAPEDSGCHGFWGCAWNAAGRYSGGVFGSVADAGRSVAAIFTTNPLTTAEDLGKEIWNTTGGAQYTQWKQCRSGGDRAACDEATRCANENIVLPGGCMIVDGIVDDTVKDDYSNGRYAQMAGRAVMNTALMFVPTKVPGLGRLGKALRDARIADDGDRVSRTPRKPAKSAQQAGKQQSAAAQRMSRFDSLKDREKTALLDRLTPSEIYHQYVLLASPAQRADVLAHLSPDQAAALYKSFPGNEDFRAYILAHVSPEALDKIDPNPKAHRFARRRKVDVKLFDGEPKVTDVAQGKYATCWCLAAMQAIVRQSPEMIENMIKENPNGTFTVTFGDGRTVTVTPDVPADGARVGKTAWPAVMEKAFAQLGGSYEEINGGAPSAALTALTGKKAVKYQTVKPSMGDIAARFRNGTAYALAFPSERALDGIPDLKRRGIQAGHAYAVVAVDPSRGTVTLANPWGGGARQVTLTQRELANAGITLSEAPTK